jgi:hypothetical protein
MDRTRRLWASPEFPGDERKTRQAQILLVTLLSFSTFLLASVVGIQLGGRTPTANLLVLVAMLASCVVAFVGLRLGLVRQAGILLIATAFLSVTAGTIGLGTIRAPLTSAYYPIILVAGLLFDLPGIAVMVALSSLAIAGLITAENAGLLPAPDPRVTITQWVTYTALYVTNGGLVMMVLGSVRMALRRARIDLDERGRAEVELRMSRQKLLEANGSLQEALAEVRTLSGLLPICGWCKRIRDDRGQWSRFEEYLASHTDASFTHGICPECSDKVTAGSP